MRVFGNNLAIEASDSFIHKHRGDIAIVEYVSVNGDIGYRIRGSRRGPRHSTRRNFLRSWTPLETQRANDEPQSTDN